MTTNNQLPQNFSKVRFQADSLRPTYAFCFAFSQHLWILEGGAKVHADCSALVYRNSRIIAAHINVFKRNSLRLAILEELDSTGLQDVKILQGLSNFVLVFVVQM